MSKVRDLNIQGGRFFICDTCGVLYTGIVGLKEGITCPKCGNRLLLKELTMSHSGYEVDERTM